MAIMDDDSSDRSLEDLLGSPARVRLVIHFLVHPDDRLHLRELQRHTGLGHRSLQRELAKLEDWELVEREEEDRRVYYVPNLRHPRWKVLRGVVRGFVARPEEVLGEALTDARDQIEAAFIYGSVATGDERSDSDLDLFVVAGDDALSRSDLSGQLMDAGVVIGREVNVKLYDSDELEEAARSPSSYLRSVLGGEKRWVIGEKPPPRVVAVSPDRTEGSATPRLPASSRR